MKTPLLFWLGMAWLSACPVFADPIVVEGGLSPNGKLAVVVLSDKVIEAEDLRKDPVAYLLDAKTHQIIGPLEEAHLDAGSWGSTLKNIKAKWRPDGHFLALDLREGRISHGYVLYKILGRRAFPQKLPDIKTIPKGKFYDTLDPGANCSDVITRWNGSTGLVVRVGPLMPKDPESYFATYGKRGLAGFNGGYLDEIYRLQKGRWVAVDLRVTADSE